MNNEIIPSNSSTDGVTKSDPVKNEKNASQNTHKYLSVRVSGNCEMCKERIEKIAKSIEGISSAEWSITTKLLTVNFDENKTNSDKIQRAIANAGHDTEKFKAPDEVYKKLPECCLYRK